MGFINDFHLQVIEVVALERIFKADEFIEDYTKCPNVSLGGVVGIWKKELGRKIVRCADLAGRCHLEVISLVDAWLLTLIFFELFCETEVPDLDLILVLQKNVLSL